MIKAIEILINNGPINKYNAIISYDNKACYLNDKKYDADDDFLNKIKEIILYWEKEYGTSNIIDAEEFTINIYTDAGTDTYHGKGVYPSNYGLLKEVLGDLNG